MTIFHTFSKRHKAPPAVFLYDGIPQVLRMQIRMVLRDAIGNWNEGWKTLNEVMTREHPIPSFLNTLGDFQEAGAPYVIRCLVLGTFDESIDALETSLRLLNVSVRAQPSHHFRVYSVTQSVDDGIAEINARSLEHGVGYQFSVDENQIIRLDSALLHTEAVAPAMRLLRSPGFEGPADEFAKAHAYQRAGEGKDAVSWAVKALESTAKAICDNRGWRYEKTDAVKNLIDIVFKNGLIPQELEAHFGGLRSALVSGLPTIGNRMTRHGQGSKVRPIEDHIVTFGMHLAAAAIVFLVDAHIAKP